VRNKRLFWVGVVSVSLILTCFYVAKVAATLGDSWTNSSTTPELSKIRDLGFNELPPYSTSSNRDCNKQKVITRAAKPFGEQSHSSCVVDTGYGAYSESGYLQRPGTSVAGQLGSVGGNMYSIIPVPRSDTNIRLSTPSVSGVNIFFTQDYSSKISSTSLVDGHVSHTAPPDYTAALADKAGNRFFAQPDSMSFSSNGQWMIVDVPFIGMVRVDLTNFSVLPFGDIYNYNIGIAPSVQSAISPDGRYVVEASKSFGTFKLYDLSTCAAVPNTITHGVSCQSRNLYGFMQSKVNNFSGVSSLRFINDDILSLYAGSQAGNSINVGQYTLGLPGAAAPSFDYLALGDSFASGEGAYQYKAITDTDNNKCHLSLRSYPYLIGRGLSLGKYESIACSGATILDIRGSDNYNEEHSQAKGKIDSSFDHEIFDSFDPGYRSQVEFIKKQLPNIITVSAVGNDIGFSDKLKRCLEPDTCYGTYEDRLEIVREINYKFDDIVNMYRDLKASGLPQAKIYAIGYPQIVATGGNCALNVHLNEQELGFSNDLITYLNSIIKAAAAHAGVAYVDAEHALDGHRLCETASPNVAVNGLTAGNDIFELTGGPIGNESYHPNHLGQMLLAARIQAQTNNFTKAMPLPDTAAVPPAENDSLPILQAPHSGRTLSRENYDENLANNVVYRSQLAQIAVTAGNVILKAVSPFSAWLNSNPVQLGTYTSDAQGNLSFQATIPADIPMGFHMLHVAGVNVIGEPVDFYKTIYVAATKDDLDGDGILNPADPCTIIEPSLTDSDKDGVDDTCDGFIDMPPLSVTNTPSSTSSPFLNSAVVQASSPGIQVASAQSGTAHNADSAVLSAQSNTSQPAFNTFSSIPTGSITGDEKAVTRSSSVFVWGSILGAVLVFASIFWSLRRVSG
jgi:lysophospholipase L1-like esterase